MHTISCKGPAEVWKTLCNIHKMKSLSTSRHSWINSFVWRYMWDEVIIMTLLRSLLTSYEYLIIAMETMLMKALMIDYVMACLMHKMSKHKEKKPCCCNKTKAAIYFCIKVSNCVSIMTKWATLCIFVTKQRTKSENKQKMRRTMTTTHL